MRHLKYNDPSTPITYDLDRPARRSSPSPKLARYVARRRTEADLQGFAGRFGLLAFIAACIFFAAVTVYTFLIA